MGNDGRIKRGRLACLICSAGLGFVLLTWLVVSLLRNPSDVSPAQHLLLIPASHPIDMPIMLLADFYEHGIEHAPPRDPSGCMQRRERNYTPPSNPFILARTKLSQTDADLALLRWLQSRQHRFALGQIAGPAEVNALQPLLANCSLSSEVLLDLGRAFSFLETDALAACWYRAGIDKAEQQFQNTPPGSPDAQPLLNLLDQTKALWRLKDHATMAKRFALAMRLNTPLSPEARRAAYLHAEMLFYQQLFEQAANAILQVQADHDKAGDLGALEASDIYEMHWVLGYFLAAARRLQEAQPHFKAVCSINCEHSRAAFCMLVNTHIRLRQFDSAKKTLAEWRSRYGIDQAWESMLAELAQAMADASS